MCFDCSFFMFKWLWQEDLWVFTSFMLIQNKKKREKRLFNQQKANIAICFLQHSKQTKKLRKKNEHGQTIKQSLIHCLSFFAFSLCFFNCSLQRENFFFPILAFKSLEITIIEVRIVFFLLRKWFPFAMLHFDQDTHKILKILYNIIGLFGIISYHFFRVIILPLARHKSNWI